MSKISESKRLKLIEEILNYQVQGEVYITTSGRIWKALVLRYFNKIEREELSLMDLVLLLEQKGGVKYNQRYELVCYPILECVQYIAKVTKRQITIN